jgi:TolB-like protein/Tfp pilus assembly protein PilF
MGFFAELKRRNVIRVAGVYIVVGWLLVQVATALEESIGLPAWFDGLIVALLLIGLPMALIFAWAFELTPEGVVRTEAVPESESITTETGRRLDYALAFAIVALVFVIIWQQSTRTDTPVAVPTAETPAAAELSPAPLDASVAVLPFTDMSAERDQEYFSDGLTEEILNLLVRADAIEVVSRTSSFQFKNTSLGIPEIAAELNVRHVVEGSVRKSGETIRVTAQLIDAVTDRHLWSNTYDRPLTAENLFEIQDDVANSIFEALSDELGLLGEIDLHAKRTTENVDAYTLFLKARELFLARRNLDAVDELLAQALQIDPDYSEAWAHKAANQFLMHDYGYSDLSESELNRRGLEEAEKALSLDPDNATAISAIGNIYVGQRTLPGDHVAHDWRDILALFDKALELDPRNPNAYNWRGLAYAWLGRIDDALADFEQCNRFEPYYVPCAENLHWYLAQQRRDEESMAVLRRNLNSGISKVMYSHLGVLARRDEELLFKAATNDVRTLRDWRYHDELYQAYKNPAGDHSRLVQSVIDFLEANPDRDSTFAYPILAAIGHDIRPPNAIGVWDTEAPGYRRSEHFKQMMRDIGAVDYWRETGLPKNCRWLGIDDFECD